MPRERMMMAGSSLAAGTAHPPPLLPRHRRRCRLCTRVECCSMERLTSSNVLGCLRQQQRQCRRTAALSLLALIAAILCQAVSVDDEGEQSARSLLPSAGLLCSQSKAGSPPRTPTPCRSCHPAQAAPGRSRHGPCMGPWPTLWLAAERHQAALLLVLHLMPPATRRGCVSLFSAA